MRNVWASPLLHTLLLFLFRFLLAFFLLLRVAHDEAGEGADAGDPD